jgi:hypothetical protein
MSEFNTNIVVQPFEITVGVQQPEITVTPTALNLNIYPAGTGVAGGNLGELQYNNGILSGIPNVTYISGNLSLGSIANVKLGGGTNGYVLQTDGAGNLDWTAMTGGGGGNGTPGGANTQIQYNDSGAFGGASGFTFNEVTGDVNIPGNVTAEVGNIGNTIISNTGIVTPGYYGNITGANVITALNVTIYDNVNLAPNIAILSNTNPVPTTPPNTLAQFKYPIEINGNTYYINLTSAI